MIKLVIFIFFFYLMFDKVDEIVSISILICEEQVENGRPILRAIGQTHSFRILGRKKKDNSTYRFSFDSNCSSGIKLKDWIILKLKKFELGKLSHIEKIISSSTKRVIIINYQTLKVFEGLSPDVI